MGCFYHDNKENAQALQARRLSRPYNIERVKWQEIDAFAFLDINKNLMILQRLVF